MPTINHVTNPTKLRRIERDSIVIRITKDKFGVRSFDLVNLNLDTLKLPNSAKIAIWAMSGDLEINFDAGTVDISKPLMNINLSELGNNKPVTFRVVVFDEKTSKILASAEDVKGRTKDENQSISPILPVETVYNLGQEIWKVYIANEERPVLQVNNLFPNIIDRLSSDHVFQALIIPQAVRQCLIHLINNDTADPSDPTAWQNKWTLFLKAIGFDTKPDAEDEIGVQTQWLDAVLIKFTNSIELMSQATRQLDRRSGD